jgi:hypothetical protein
MDPRLFMRTKRNAAEEVEKGLAGAGKLKLLRLLMKQPTHAFTRYEIGKKIANDPISIRNDLKTLVQIDWVVEFNVQHLSKYSINLENPVVRHVFDFLLKLEYIR